MAPNICWVVCGKAGVGKSMVSMALLDSLLAAGLPALFVEGRRWQDVADRGWGVPSPCSKSASRRCLDAVPGKADRGALRGSSECARHQVDRRGLGHHDGDRLPPPALRPDKTAGQTRVSAVERRRIVEGWNRERRAVVGKLWRVSASREPRLPQPLRREPRSRL